MTTQGKRGERPVIRPTALFRELMNKRFWVAGVAAFGLLSSTLALAEVADSVTGQTLNVPEAPAVVAENVATPVPVEPAAQPAPMPAVATDDSADPADSLEELVAETDPATDLDQQTRCLATAVYYEARSESLAGQLAVAHVVLARARSGRFPSSPCGVVTQPGQFSFVRAGRLPEAPKNAGQWRTARVIARIAEDGSWENPAHGALFFHAARVSPDWNRPRVTRIGGHVFYR